MAPLVRSEPGASSPCGEGGREGRQARPGPGHSALRARAGAVEPLRRSAPASLLQPGPGSGGGAMAAEGRAAVAAAELQPEGDAEGGGSSEPEGGFGQLLEEEEDGEDAGYVLYRYGRGGAVPRGPSRGGGRGVAELRPQVWGASGRGRDTFR